MPDPYQELDVFGRPKSRVDGVPYVAFDDDLAALQNYVLNLRAKEEAIESGARTPRRVKEIVREGGRLPGYIHPYKPGYVVQEQERLRDETDPVQFLPIVRQGVENVRAIANEGFEKPEYIDAKLFGQRAPQYLNTLGSQVRKGGPGFEARFGEWQDPWVTGGDPAFRGSLTGRTQMWPEKMARSGATLAGDVMSGRVMTGPGLRATDFSDIPGAPNPLAPLIERTQDLAGMAMGGSIPELAARGVDRNTLGSGFVPKEPLTSELRGGTNVPEAAPRNIGRETMPEILARQRASEGYEAAIRDPETKKLYTGMWHEEVLDKIAKDKGVPKDQLPSNLVKGYVNDRGRFLTEDAVERMSQNRSKTAMFRADDEVGAAVAAMHAAEGKPSRVPMSKYSQTKGNFDHLVAAVEKNLNKNGEIPLKNVKVSELRGTQERLSDFGGGDPVFEELNDHPVVVEDKHGEKVLIDGHHRVNGAINDKVDTIPVHYIKLSADDEAGAAIGTLRNSVAPTFYSGLGRTIERAPFETATPSQWMKHLRDTVGARQAEEFEHVGLEGRLGPLAEVKAPVERKAQAALEEWKAANKGQRPPKELTDAASNENKRIVEQRLAEKGAEKPLTKAELLAHVAGNQPKFKEITKGKSPDETEAAIHERATEMMEDNHPEITPQHRDYQDYFADAVHEAETEMQHDTSKYSDYQLPGGTNYREHLMTMPERPISENLSKYAERMESKYGPNYFNKMTHGERAQFDVLHKEGNPSAQNHYSSHWDEPNVIVHTRMNDRDLGGAKSLHAEEFQSDLHQEGRKKGYKGDKPNTSKWTAEKETKTREWGPIGTFDKWTVKNEKGDVVGTLDMVNREHMTPKEAIDKVALEHRYGIVPNFPFKKSWPDLAIKRWLREAVDNDYDAVSWTPGEAQRDRFQLAHHIENLYYDKRPDGSYVLDADNKQGGRVPINRSLPIKADDLSRYVGDAVAEKIKKDEGIKLEDGGTARLRNADLKVGGEGLVSFYDKTVKGKVEALVEKFGGKVEKHKIGDTPEDRRVKEINKRIAELRAEPAVANKEKWQKVGEELRELQSERLMLEHEAGRTLGKDTGADFVWSVKLTPEMKRAIRSEGFPLFTAGPVMIPVDHDPFDKKQKPKPKLEPVEHDPFAQPTPDLGGTLNKLISTTGGYRPRPRPIQNGFGRRQ